MRINKNIMKKIMDKMALNKWKNKVKKINGEYNHYFEWNGYLSLNSNNFHQNRNYIVYSYRENEGPGSIWNCKIRKCSYCDKYHPSVFGYSLECQFPEKYFYSSGMNHRNGYKKKLNKNIKSSEWI